MGVHARRAARRTTPLVAAAAGIGTVAAMLGPASPAAAASIVLDPAFGNKTGTVFAGAVSGNAAGLIPTRGVDALELSGDSKRIVLGQEGSGQRRVTLTKFLADGSTLDSAFGGGQVSVVVPTGTTVQRLLSDGTNLYVIGQNSTNVIIVKVLATDGSVVSAYGTGGTATLATGAAAGWTWSIADAAANHTNFGSNEASGGTTVDLDDVGGLVVGINLVDNNGLKSAKILRVVGSAVGAPYSGAGTLDPTFGTSGAYTIPSGVQIGGLSVLALAATPALAKIAVSYMASGNAAPDDDLQSRVVELTSKGAAATFGTAGVSSAIETYADNTSNTGGPSKSRWTDEMLGRIVEASATSLLVAGRTGGNTFLANLDQTGALATGSFGPLGSSTPVPTGGGGVTWVPTTCGNGPTTVFFKSSPTFYYLKNVCDDGRPEFVRVYTNGIPDNAFNGGSASWKADLPVNGQAATISSTGVIRVGTANADGSDAATAQLVPPTAPTGTTVTATGSTTVVAGTAVTLVATATGTPVPAATFRWETKPNASASLWVPVQNSEHETISGTNSRTLRIATNGTMDQRQYRAVALNPAGEGTASTATTLTVLGIAPVITKQPMNATGEDGGWAMFSAEASGDPAPSWNWQWQAPGQMTWNDIMNGPNIEGATTSMLKIKNLTKGLSGNKYRAIASNTADTVVSDGKATLTVTDKGTHEPEPEPGDEGTTWGDYNGDGKTDIASYKDGQFYWNGAEKPDMFGKPGDKLVVGNFDDDAAFDKAVVRGATWITDGNPNVGFGRATDMPVSGDFDGDGQTDIAVWRPSNGTWYVQDGDTVQWGQAGDIPVPGDYDGDGSDEFAVFRPSNGIWYVYGAGRTTYGKAGDLPVRGDWNGDGQTDPAVFRPSNNTWYILGVGTTVFGAKGDVPLAGDFDGDGKSDRATYRPSNSTWNFQGKPSVKFGGAGWWPITGVK